MRRLLILLNVLFLTFAGLAQNQDQDPKAKGILDEISKKNKAYKTITIEFEYIYESPNSPERIRTGKAMLKGDKYYLEMGANMIFYNGKESIAYNSDDNEYEYQDEEDEINPNKIFNVWETGFKFKYQKELTENGKKYDLIYLFPVDPKEKPYHRIELKIDKTKNQVASFKTVGKDQKNYTYKIKKFTTNVVIADSNFEFNPDDYPGSEER